MVKQGSKSKSDKAHHHGHEYTPQDRNMLVQQEKKRAPR